MNEISPEMQMLGIVNNFWQGQCAGAAAELLIADHLADGPLHIEELARQTGTHAQSLYRVLRALESTGIFRQTEPQVFANTALSECLQRDRPGSNWAWIRLTLSSGALVFEGWRGLAHSIREGTPGLDAVTGMHDWEYLQKHPEMQTIFNAAMRDLSASISPAVAAAYDWGRFDVIADVGGGIGAQLSSILAHHSAPKGMLFDMPEVVAQAPENSRMETVGGSFFEPLGFAADAYMLRWVMHDWPDDRCIEILGHIKDAAPSGARLMVVESVIPETSGFDMGKWMDVNMMVMSNGRERTKTEFTDLLGQAGFEIEEIVPTASPLSIIVARLAD